MIRAFVAVALPDEVRWALAGLADRLDVPDPVPTENLHLTLAFLGEMAEPVLEDAHFALASVRAPGFAIALAGVGMFGGSRPRTVHVEVRDPVPLRHLQAKVASAVRGTGLRLEARRYVPHVTLARLRPFEPEALRLASAVAAHGSFALPPFEVKDFSLFRSRLRPTGAVYEELARYALG